MDKASDYESGDSRFESWRGRVFLEFRFFLFLLHLDLDLDLELEVDLKLRFCEKNVAFIDVPLKPP